MKWYNYIACFFAGFFLVNAIPHFTHGVSGDSFPSPFASPPGKGLSSPMINTLWALLNIAVGLLLYRAGKLSSGNKTGIAIFAVAFVIGSIMLTSSFVDKMPS